MEDNDRAMKALDQITLGRETFKQLQHAMNILC